MVAHGLITGMLFFLAGSVKHRYHTLEISRLSGMLIQMPKLGWLLGFAAHHARTTGLAAVEIQLSGHGDTRIAWLQRHGFAPLAPTGNRILLRRPANT